MAWTGFTDEQLMQLKNQTEGSSEQGRGGHVSNSITLTQQELTKAHYNMKKIVLSRTMSSLVGLYGYGNAGRAVSQVWRAMGDHRFGVREVPGSNPGGTPIFEGVSFK